MVTKYDVFEYIYNHPSKPKDITNYFKKPYQSIYKILLELNKLNLITKDFQIIKNKHSELLYQIIHYCINNNLNYNDLLDKNITNFISKAMNKEFTIKDFKLNPRTYNNYINILNKYGFLIILSKKPLKATLLYSSFLKDLCKLFNHKIKTTTLKGNYIKEIKKEITLFKKLSKNYQKYKVITEEYKIKFIHHSLNLEGNPITLPETIKLLKKHITPKELNLEDVQEVQNYQLATNEMIKDSESKKPLTKTSILNYHYLAMRHRDMAGKIRVLPVIIKGNPLFKTAKVKDIEPKLDKLLKKYNNFKEKDIKKILDFASYFHNEFQYIHPFLDGNSRTTRLITFYLLRIHNIPIFDIPLGLLEEYLFSTKASKKRSDKVLSYVLQRVILYNLKVINEKLL